ncbi:MAG: MurR/RpiR family transcriptional regulator [Solobacterium sp.]|nr:MurR/RpiR family transcriptional regulator [Solobacterium sp.]
MALNPLDRIRSYYEDMTKTDREIAAWIMDNPRDAARSTIGALAEYTHTSKAALVRFSTRIGYNGFAEFKFDLSRYLVSRNASQTETSAEADSFHAITDTYTEYIKRIPECFDREDLDRISDLLIRSRRTKIFGVNRTFNSARQLKQRLLKIGIDAEAVCDTTDMSDTCEMLTEEDLLVIFTITDNAGIYNDHVVTAAGHDCPVICFTMTPALPFKKMCSHYIVLPRISRDSSISFLDDQAIFLVFIEILLNTAAAMTR